MMKSNYRPLGRVITAALGALMSDGVRYPVMTYGDVVVEDGTKEARPVTSYDLNRIEAAEAKRERRRRRNLSK